MNYDDNNRIYALRKIHKKILRNFWQEWNFILPLIVFMQEQIYVPDVSSGLSLYAFTPTCMQFFPILMTVGCRLASNGEG